MLLPPVHKAACGAGCRRAHHEPTPRRSPEGVAWATGRVGGSGQCDVPVQFGLKACRWKTWACSEERAARRKRIPTAFYAERKVSSPLGVSQELMSRFLNLQSRGPKERHGGSFDPADVETLRLTPRLLARRKRENADAVAVFRLTWVLQQAALHL